MWHLLDLILPIINTLSSTLIRISETPRKSSSRHKGSMILIKRMISKVQECQNILVQLMIEMFTVNLDGLITFLSSFPKTIISCTLTTENSLIFLRIIRLPIPIWLRQILISSDAMHPKDQWQLNLQVKIWRLVLRIAAVSRPCHLSRVQSNSSKIIPRHHQWKQRYSQAPLKTKAFLKLKTLDHHQISIR